jgi:hypothetical protein
MLAIGSLTKVRLYIKCRFKVEYLPSELRFLLGETGSKWEYHYRLPELSTSGKGQTFPVEVVAVAWLPQSEKELLTSYKYHGIRWVGLNPPPTTCLTSSDSASGILPLGKF